MANWKQRFSSSAPSGDSFAHSSRSSPVDLWRRAFREVILRLKVQRGQNRPVASGSPGTSGSPGAEEANEAGGGAALVAVEHSKLIRKSIAKTVRAQNEIASLTEALNQYRTQDSPAFEEWKRQLFSKERADIERAREALKATADKLREMERARGLRSESEEGNEEASEARAKADAEGRRPCPDCGGFHEHSSESGPEGKEDPNFRHARLEDDFLSDAAWEFMSVCLDLLEEPAFDSEFKELEMSEVDTFIEQGFFESMMGLGFLKKKEQAYIRQRLADELRKRLTRLRPAPTEGATDNPELLVRTLYRKLATRLHPDRLEGEVTERHRNLWNDLQRAYAARDVQGLRDIEIRHAFHFERDKGGLSLDDINKVHENLRVELKTLRTELRKVRKNPDFEFIVASASYRNEIARHIKETLNDELRELKEVERFLKWQISILSSTPQRPMGRKTNAGKARVGGRRRSNESEKVSPESEAFYSAFAEIFGGW